MEEGELALGVVAAASFLKCGNSSDRVFLDVIIFPKKRLPRVSPILQVLFVMVGHSKVDTSGSGCHL
jgi:hypothetical protein